jgi:hypothetical protein
MQVGRVNRELRLLESELESLRGRIDANRFLGVFYTEFLDSLNRLAAEKEWTVTQSANMGDRRFYVKKTGGNNVTKEFCVIIHDERARYEYRHERGTETSDYSDLGLFTQGIASSMDIFQQYSFGSPPA